MQAYRTARFYLQQSEKSFPFSIPLTGVNKIAKKNTTFEKQAKGGNKGEAISVFERNSAHKLHNFHCKKF